MGLSYNADIRPLFRDSDIDSMRDISAFDLGKLEDVRSHSADIYARLVQGDMPCDAPWPEEQTARFKQWMDEGMQP